MLPLESIKQLKEALVALRSTNSADAVNYLRSQPNKSANKEAAALITAFNKVTTSKKNDIDSWIEKLNRHITYSETGKGTALDDVELSGIFNSIKRFSNSIANTEFDKLLNDFHTADGYDQMSDPAHREDLANVIDLADKLSAFGQIHTILNANPALDNMIGLLNDYKEKDDQMLLREKWLSAIKPKGVNPVSLQHYAEELQKKLQKEKEDVQAHLDARPRYHTLYEEAKVKYKAAQAEYDDIQKRSETIKQRIKDDETSLKQMAETIQEIKDLETISRQHDEQAKNLYTERNKAYNESKKIHAKYDSLYTLQEAFAGKADNKKRTLQQQRAKEYFELTMNYMQWNRVNDLIFDFYNKFKTNGNVLVTYLDGGLSPTRRADLEKTYSSMPGDAGEKMREAKTMINEIKALCPDPKWSEALFANKKGVDYAVHLHNMLKESSQKANKASEALRANSDYASIRRLELYEQQLATWEQNEANARETVQNEIQKAKKAGITSNITDDSEIQMKRAREQEFNALATGYHELLTKTNLDEDFPPISEIDNTIKELYELKRQGKLEEADAAYNEAEKEYQSAASLANDYKDELYTKKLDLFKKFDPGFQELNKSLITKKVTQQDLDNYITTHRQNILNLDLDAFYDRAKANALETAKNLEAAQEKAIANAKIKCSDARYEADQYSPASYKKTLLDKLDNINQNEKKLSRVKRERKFFSDSLSSYNQLVDSRQKIMDAQKTYSDPTDAVAATVSAKANFFISEFAKNKSTFHRNGAKYNDIRNKLTALSDPTTYANNPDDLKNRLRDLKKAADDYLAERSQDKVKTNGKMRHFRLNFAKRIIAYCVRTSAALDNATWTMTDSIKAKLDDISKKPDKILTDEQYADALKKHNASYIRINDTSPVTQRIEDLKQELDTRLDHEARQRGLEGDARLSKTEFKNSVLRSALYLDTLDRLENNLLDPKTDGSPDIETVVNNLYDKTICQVDETVSKMQMLPRNSVLIKALEQGKHSYYSTRSIQDELAYMDAGTRLKDDFHADIDTIAKAPEQNVVAGKRIKPPKESPQKDANKKEATKKDAAKKGAPQKGAPKKEATKEDLTQKESVKK